MHCLRKPAPRPILRVANRSRKCVRCDSGRVAARLSSGVGWASPAPGPASAVQASSTVSGTLSVSLPRKTSGQRWYYYVRAVQADGNVLWSAPIWIFWQ
jgi:hypothetical protein